MTYPLRGLVSLWNEKIDIAKKHKKKVFGDDADMCLRYYEGNNDEFFSKMKGASGLKTDDDLGVDPSFRMSVNKTAELVQLFGPGLYFRNPIRLVRPREQPPIDPMMFMPPPDPMMMGQMDPMMLQQMQQMMMQQIAQQQMQTQQIRQSRAALMESYLNYTPNELNLKFHSRRGIDEALIKGRGIAWSEVYRRPQSPRAMVGSFFDTVDNLYIDPDAETLEDAQWIARKCEHPVWMVEDEYQLPRGTLKKGGYESFASSAAVNVSQEKDKKRNDGSSNDMFCYYKVWTRMGIGDKLSGGDKRNIAAQAEDVLSQFGEYVYLVVAPGINFFLNLPPYLMEAPMDEAVAGAIQQSLSWPTPFWKDGEWPFTELDFHFMPRNPWGGAHLKFAMGELQFIDLMMSSLAGKVRTTMRDFIVLLESVDEETRDAILKGKDLTVIPLKGSQHKNINEVIQFLQHPAFNKDPLVVIDRVVKMFEERTGISEMLATGQTEHQFRSAQEAAVKDQFTRIRPDDMANQVEDWQSRLARKEAIAARMHLKGQDIGPVMGGQMYGQLWDQLIASVPLEELMDELDYRIEASSAQKPNLARDSQYMTALGQALLPIFQAFAMQTGQVGPLNNFIIDMAKTFQLDGTKYTVQPPPPPMPPGQPGQEPQQGKAAA